jgi:hypothetical protein
VNRLATLLLVVGYVAGFGLIGLELTRSEATDERPVTPADIATPDLTPPPLPIQSLDDYAAIIERPLFHSDRAPSSEVQVLDAPAADLVTDAGAARLDGLRLAAVFRGAERRTALVELPDGKSLTVREGDRIYGWQVVEIRDEQLVLGNRGQQRTLEVHDLSYLGEPPIPQRLAPRTRALTERRRPANRRRPGSTQNTPTVPRQTRRQRTEEREEDD